MKICILGAGAMGCMLGGYLKLGGAEVHFIDPYEAHMNAISKDGLKLKMQHADEEWTIDIDSAATTSEGVGICDLVVVLVKGLQTREIVKENLGIVGPDTIVATFQNGIGNIDIINEFVPEENVGFGVLKNGATILAPGKVFGYLTGDANVNYKELYYAPVKPNDHVLAAFEEFHKLLDKNGFTSAHYPDAEALVWDKLYLNALVNIPLALQRVHVEIGVRDEYMAHLLKQAGEEVCAVATAKGFPMDAEEYWQTNIVPIATKPLSEGLHYTSAVLDTQRRRPTEVDFLNGAVVREGRKLGIPTPVNEFFWYMGKACVDFYEDSF